MSISSRNVERLMALLDDCHAKDLDKLDDKGLLEEFVLHMLVLEAADQRLAAIRQTLQGRIGRSVIDPVALRARYNEMVARALDFLPRSEH